MGIRQQKREKPNAYAKTGNTSTVEWSNSDSGHKTLRGKKSSKTTAKPHTPTEFLIKDLLRTSVAFAIAVGVLVVIWWLQSR